MATVHVYSHGSFDMPLAGEATSATPSLVEVVEWPLELRLNGSFSYEPALGGTLTGMDIEDLAASDLLYEVTGLAHDAAMFLDLTLTDPELAAAWLFSGPDTVIGDGQDNHLYGYAGADTLTGGGGSDFVDGSWGIDTARLEGLGAVVNYWYDGDWWVQGTAGLQHFHDVERVAVGDLLVGLDTSPGGHVWEAEGLLWAWLGRAPDATQLSGVVWLVPALRGNPMGRWSPPWRSTRSTQYGSRASRVMYCCWTLQRSAEDSCRCGLTRHPAARGRSPRLPRDDGAAFHQRQAIPVFLPNRVHGCRWCK